MELIKTRQAFAICRWIADGYGGFPFMERPSTM